MRVSLLHVDDALEAQPDFIRACKNADAELIWVVEDASAIRLWGRQQRLDDFRKALVKQFTGNKSEPRLTFMGSSDFHHITAFLVAFALENQSAPITIVHFDNHPDWVKFENGMHCGSWINRALKHPKVEKMITLGVCSRDLKRPEWKGANLALLSQGLLELYPYDHAPSRVKRDYGSGASFAQKKGALHWKTIRNLGEQNFTDHLLSRIKTKSVYLTIDKDVLAREDAITNWDQGCMRIPYLLSLVKEIGQRHPVIGADVTGDYSTPRYSGDLWTRLSKHAEIFMDQPRRKPDLAQAVNINSAANHALLEVLSEVMT
jgi:arginase family enzyme